MFASLVISNALFSTPQFGRVSKFVDRVVSASNLKSGFAVASFLIHPIVGVSTLSAMYKSGRLSFRETAYSVALSTLPRGFRAAVLFLAPIAISVFGLKVGALFVSVDLVSRFAVFFLLIAIAKTTLDGDGDDDESLEVRGFDLLEVLKVFLRTVVVIFASTFLTFLIFQFNDYGDANLLILLSGAVSTAAGMGVAGTLMHSGVMGWKAAVILVYISRILHVFVESLRMSMPIYTSFFGVRTGMKLLAIHVVSNSVSIALAAFLFALVSHAF